MPTVPQAVKRYTIRFISLTFLLLSITIFELSEYCGFVFSTSSLLPCFYLGLDDEPKNLLRILTMGLFVHLRFIDFLAWYQIFALFRIMAWISVFFRLCQAIIPKSFTVSKIPTPILYSSFIIAALVEPVLISFFQFDFDARNGMVLGFTLGVISLSVAFPLSLDVEEEIKKMRLENHTHIRHIMLYHYEKEWTAAQSFRDLNELSPHVERRVIEFIANKGWDLLPHPPYSPTEAPTDYHVNRSLKNWQTNKVYDDLDDLVADVKAWIASKNRDFFARGIDRLPSKWEAVLEVDGDYALE
ncbi:unnamed protein product, partial [Mesorhabditis belari]|uniref:Mos1 transposase HTH domain-containing protein n=1 Tax=Mesorhabditis belari TaxID=2138241 RepID=A0AAF3J3A3_9BILA